MLVGTLGKSQRRCATSAWLMVAILAPEILLVHVTAAEIQPVRADATETRKNANTPSEVRGSMSHTFKLTSIPDSDYAKYWPNGRRALFKLSENLVVGIPPEYQQFWRIRDNVVREPAALESLPQVGSIGFDFFVPGFSGYTRKNFRNPWDKGKVSVIYFQRVDLEVTAPDAPGHYAPNAIGRLLKYRVVSSSVRTVAGRSCCLTKPNRAIGKELSRCLHPLISGLILVVARTKEVLEGRIVALPDVYFEQRVRYLVESGKLEAQGDLSVVGVKRYTLFLRSSFRFACDDVSGVRFSDTSRR